MNGEIRMTKRRDARVFGHSDFAIRISLLKITLTPALSRHTGRGGKTKSLPKMDSFAPVAVHFHSITVPDRIDHA
ncbi:MAG TPA: hypothetical protein VLI90_11040 [Tepidisphaeraceae bacterium]|nr:hypothetical protein [Tepidisphaeraceae bacterium]